MDTQALNQAFQQQALLGFLDLFSGGALANLSVAALGVYPYITASIVMQILVPVMPKLKALAQEGEYGPAADKPVHALVDGAHRVPAVLWPVDAAAAVRGPADVRLRPEPADDGNDLLDGGRHDVSRVLGELITERGLGNGISLIIFGGIVSRFPQVIGQGFLQSDQTGGLMLLGLFGFGIIYTIVLFNEAQRRVPVQYGRSVFRGGRMQRQAGSTFLPLRVNSAGMIPLIFAFSIIILPATVASYFRDPLSDGFFARVARFFSDTLDPSNFPYWGAVFFLVVIFTFFYTLVIFNQQNLSENLQRNGGFIPGIRPGRPTQEYLNRVIVRITWGGALFLGIIAILPYFVTQVTDVRALTLSSTSLLIMVGVALDTMRQLEAQLLMRNYEGFIR